MIRLAFCAVALGSTEPEPDYFESQPTTLLQHGLQVTSLDRQDKQAAELLSEIQNLRIMNQGSPVLPNIDANGRLCFLCGTPSEERAPNQTYVIRDDCGNHSLLEYSAMMDVPLSNFQRNATEEHNATFGWCELNVEKTCADAIYNQDYMIFAKSVEIPDVKLVHYKVASWDQYYCLYNGWISKEVRALQHDFQGMYLKGQELCNSDELVQRGSKGNMTMWDMLKRWLPALPGFPGSRPSYEDAKFMAAWTCAMGSAACDMAYCAYTYCLKGDGIGTYHECEGWDPVNGMPIDM